MRPLSILILTDQRQGHEQLAVGVATAISRIRPAEVRTLTARRGLIPGGLLAAMTNSGLAPEAMLRRVYGLNTAEIGRPDVIVSAGAETLAANIAAARLLSVPNIHYGSLRRFRSRDFALVLTSYVRDGATENEVMTLKPARFDPASLPVLPERPTGSWPRLVGLIIGGPAAGYRFSADDWQRIAATMSEANIAHGTRWLVSNSRRTPAAVSDRFRALAEPPGSMIEQWIDVREPQAKSLADLLGRSELILVTADSSSMLSEAVWARRPAIALTPAGAKPTADEAGYRSFLGAKRWVGALGLEQLDAAGIARAHALIAPMKDNPIEALAALIATHVPCLALRGDET
jgi:mitochondrial fission protein ELM1